MKNRVDYNRKIVLGYREPYPFESREFYYSIPLSKRIKAYVVLDALEEGLLVSRLKYLESIKERKNAILKTDYPGINYASLPDGTVYVLPEGNIFCTMSDKMEDVHLNNLIVYLRSSCLHCMDSDIRAKFLDFCNRYFRESINVGTIVTISNADDTYSVYYVKEKLESDFLAVTLHYDSSTGLSVDGEELYIPYDSRYCEIVNSKEYSLRVSSMIDEHKLKKLKGN